MSLRSFFMLSALLLPALSLAAPPTLEQSLNDCIDSHFNEGVASNINDEFEVVESCPELFYHMQNSKVLDEFDPPLDETTSLNQLLDIRFLLTERTHPDDAIYTAADRVFLDRLTQDDSFEDKPVEASLWDRFVAWLKERYQTQDEAGTDWSWLIDFLESGSIPDWLGEAIYYTSIGLVIILALLIVINELRAANIGKWRKRRRKSSSAGGWENGLATIDALDWNSIGKLPLQQQPGAMLRFVIDDLIERGWISDNRSLTNREMWRELRRQHRDSAQQFNQAINIAERSVYGDEALEPQQVEALYNTAQSIVSKPGDGAS